MPANFPTSPSLGDRHTISDKTWEWTGTVWDLVVSTNTLQFSADDSAIITVDLAASEELRIVGDGTSISTSGSAGDSSNSTLQISLNKTIDVNEIISSDSTLVTIVDGLATPLLTSLDSSAIQINDGINVRGSITLESGTSVNQILDEDNMASDSDTALATQQSIKAYVDSQITSTNTLKIGDDASSEIELNLDDTLNAKGGNSISITVSGDTLTVALESIINIDKIDQSAGVVLPVGTTAERSTVEQGIIRFNTDTGLFEGSLDGSTFTSFSMASGVGGGTAVITKEQFLGDGSSTQFTLTTSPSDENNVIVYVDGVMQEPDENYTLSGTILSFTGGNDGSTIEAPHRGARIVVMLGFDAL